MPEFTFSAQDKLGNAINGAIDAPDVLIASNEVGRMGYALIDIKEKSSGSSHEPALPNPPPDKPLPSPPQDILLADVEKRRKVEQDLARMGMTPVEIQRLLNADANTTESKEPVIRRGSSPDAKSNPLFSPNANANLPTKGKAAAVRQKRDSRASDLESFAAQLAASNSAKRIVQEKEIEIVNLDLPEFRESSIQEIRQTETLLRDASALRRREKYSEAIAKCREALALTPSDATALELLGDLFQGVARTSEALSAYRRATEADPKRFSAERKYGDLLMRQQEWPDDDPEEVPKNPVVSAVFSLLFPGAGQIHNLQYVKGAVMLGGALLCVGAWFVFGTGKQAYETSQNRPSAKTTVKRSKLTVEWGSEMPLLISRVCYIALMIGSAADAYSVAKRNFRR